MLLEEISRFYPTLFMLRKTHLLVVEVIRDQILMSAQLINCFQNPIVENENVLIVRMCINAAEPKFQ